MATNTRIGGYKYYRITRTIGHTADGKPIKKQFLGSCKAEAEAKYISFIRDKDRLRGEILALQATSTLHARAKDYIDNVLNRSDRLAAGTKKKYRNCYANHIAGTWLDRMVVSDITAADIQRFYNNIDVSKAVLETINKFLSGLWKWMVRCGYANDVLSAVETPAKTEIKKKSGIVIWTDQELDAIKAGLDGRRDKFLFLTLIYTGMRISEVLGLKYEDIEDDMIHVRRQYAHGELIPPKWYSVRDVPLHPVLAAALPEHRKEYGCSDYIFTTQSGCLYNDANLRREASRYYKRINVTDKAFHAFRATFATNLCKAGVPLEVASKLLGHSSVSVTARYYTYITDQAKRDAVSKLK